MARRAQQEAEKPQLAFRISDRSTGSGTELLIENVGQGVGLFVGFLILSGNGLASSGYTSPPSNLWPQKLARVDLPFQTVEGALGIVWCADRRRNVHAWNAEHGYKVYPRRKVKKVKKHLAASVFRDLHAGSDLSAVTFLKATPQP